MPRVTRLGHTGIYVHDLDKMRDFYSRVLGLTITDEDLDRGLVFFSSRPQEEHHEFVIMRGRTGPDGRTVTVRSRTLAAVPAMERICRADGRLGSRVTTRAEGGASSCSGSAREGESRRCVSGARFCAGSQSRLQ